MAKASFDGSGRTPCHLDRGVAGLKSSTVHEAFSYLTEPIYAALPHGYGRPVRVRVIDGIEATARQPGPDQDIRLVWLWA
jgi:hypothetical protein